MAVEVVGHGMTTYTLDYAAGNRVLVETTPTSTVTYLYGHECLGEVRDAEVLYYLNDAEGLVRQGVDADGAVVSAWLFDPDGALLEGPHGPVSHLVCGGVYDWSTGLLYQDGGYFDPLLGLWLALAPLVVVSGWRKKRRRRGRHPWLALLCVGLFAVGSLAGCGGTPSPIVSPLPTSQMCFHSYFPIVETPILFTPKLWIHNESCEREQKLIEFQFTVRSEAERTDYVLVQLVKGYIEDLPDGNPPGNLSNVLNAPPKGPFVRGRHLGRNDVEWNFSDWEIDSPEVDPVYWSDRHIVGSRWNYEPVSATVYKATDRPQVYNRGAYKMYLEFKMCLLKNEDVPEFYADTFPSEIERKAIQSVDWEVKSVFYDDKRFISPCSMGTP